MRRALPALLLFILMAAVSCTAIHVKSRGHHGPPHHVLHSAPSMFVIHGTYAYFVDGIDVEIFFHSGHWYRPHKGRWYRGRGYNGPWSRVAKGNVPGVFRNLPPGYRKVAPGHRRIPHGQLNKNWKSWERDRHWDKPKAKPRVKPKAKPRVKPDGKHNKRKGKQKGKSKRRNFKNFWPFK